MDEEQPRKRQTTKFSRSARNKRIMERAREGFGYDEIARDERLTERRVRQIVTEALKSREGLASSLHTHLQIDRVGRAMRVAGEALGHGDLRAVAPFLKAVEKLDHYQALAREFCILGPAEDLDPEAVVRAALEEDDWEAAEAAPASVEQE